MANITPGNPTGAGGFQKGKSGNPGGRPKENGVVRELARQHSVEALLKIVDLMRTSTNEKVILSSAEYLIDRGYGRPAQAIVGGENDEPPLRVAGVIDLVRPGIIGS